MMYNMFWNSTGSKKKVHFLGACLLRFFEKGTLHLRSMMGDGSISSLCNQKFQYYYENTGL